MGTASIYLIGGFLGSGKTTLLQRILNWNIDLSSTAVMVNEFGQISVDGMLLHSEGTRLMELASGCICCSMRGEFVRSLEQILNEFAPARIFVEATGVADTADIIDLLDDSDVYKKARLKKIICVLDSDLWQGRDYFGTVFFNQVKVADLILLNKIDLVHMNQVPIFIEEIRQINPRGAVIPTYHCMVDADILLQGDEPEPSQRLDMVNLVPDFGVKGDVDLEFMTFAFQDDGHLSETRFREFIGKTPFRVFRIKGLVRFPGRTFMLNHVGGRSHWTEVKTAQGTRLVFVGWKMDTDAIWRDLVACREAT